MNHDDETKRSALLIAVLAAFLTPFMVSSINIALPAIGREFNMSAIAMSWVPTAYLLSAVVFLVPLGRLADIYGRKKIFSYGIKVYSLTAMLLALSPSGPFFIALRLLEGFGGAMIFGTGTAIVTSVFPPGERGRVLGINVAAIYLGLSLGPSFGGFLTQQFGWRSIFLTNIPIGLLVLYLLSSKLHGEWVGSRGERFDRTGAVIYGIMLAAFMLGLSSLPTPKGLALIIVSVACMGIFVRWEMNTESPLLDLKLFADNMTYTFSNLAALINYSATFAVTFLLSLYLQYIKGFTPQHAGMILVSQPIIMSLVSPFAGRLSDRIETRVVASLGMVITSVGLFLFAHISSDVHVKYIVLGLMLLGFGFALFSSPNTNAVMGSIDKRFYGVGSATLGTMRLTGQMLSMGIAMVVFAIYMGGAVITPEMYSLFLTSMKTAFIIFSSLCFIGVFASLARGKMR